MSKISILSNIYHSKRVQTHSVFPISPMHHLSPFLVKLFMSHFKCHLPRTMLAIAKTSCPVWCVVREWHNFCRLIFTSYKTRMVLLTKTMAHIGTHTSTMTHNKKEGTQALLSLMQITWHCQVPLGFRDTINQT